MRRAPLPPRMLLAVCLLAGWSASGLSMDDSCLARIDVDAQADQVELKTTGIGDGGTFKDAGSWLGERSKYYVCAQFYARPEEWTPGHFSFRPGQDGKIALKLQGPWVAKAGGGIERVEMLFDSVTVSGATLENGGFESPKSGWKLAAGQRLSGRETARAGESCVKVWHNEPVTQIIAVKQGQEVKVSAWFRRADSGAAQPTKPHYVDLTAAANLDLTDETAGDGRGGWSDQGANDLRMFDPQINSYKGVCFRPIDPAKNEHKAVLTFAGEKLTAPVALHSVEVACPAPPAPFLYLLHTTCWNKQDEGGLVGTLKVGFKDGGETAFEIKTKREVADWWLPVAWPNGLVGYRSENPESPVGLYVSKFRLGETPREVAKLSFSTAGGPIWIVLAATLDDRDIVFRGDQTIIQANEEWRPIDMSDLRVQAGSALDFSAWVGDGPAGQHGRLIATPAGQFAFEKQPEKPVRFLGNSIDLGGLQKSGIIDDKASIEEFAALTRRQGYNIVRPHFLDHALLKDSKADLEFNPEMLDIFDYLVHCLKQNGVYIYFDAMTSWSGYTKGSGWSQAAKDQHLKSRMLWDQSAREHWVKGVRQLLTHENPYTKSRLVDDPAVAITLFFNEQELDMASACHQEGFLNLWREWLKRKYPTFAALQAAWRDAEGRGLLKDETDFAQLGLSTGPDKTQRGVDTGEFLAERMLEVTAWYGEQLRQIGYPGLTSQWDCHGDLLWHVARRDVTAVSMHGYHAHPSSYINKNSVQSQESSLKSACRYFTRIASARDPGRPFFITEYQHCFWNAHRYEQGLVMGAYSALQGYGGIMEHAQPVSRRQWGPIHTFHVSGDPVGRASDVIAGLCFMRGDVAPAGRGAVTVLERTELEKRAALTMGVPESQARTALVTGYGVICRPLAPGQKEAAADLTLTLTNRQYGGNDEAFPLEQLKASGLLPADNRTDPDQGIYESATGQIRLDTRTQGLQVVTPRSEGICLGRPTEGVKLGALTVKSTNVPAAVVAAAIDGEELAASRRILLVYATDALNSGMTFADPERTLLRDNGKLPVLLRAGQLSLSLANRQPADLKAWALSLTGQRQEELPIQAGADGLELRIDTGKLTKGPAVFFEIAAE